MCGAPMSPRPKRRPIAQHTDHERMIGSTRLWLWKMERKRPGKSPEVHPTAGGNKPTFAATPEKAQELAALYPGWYLTHG